MYPHERSLVKRLKGKSFALLGINSDSNRAQLKTAMAQEHITWRSWWDKNQRGLIASSWNIHAWPSVFVLDAHGIVRYKDVRGEALDKAVDTLLDELNREAPSRTSPPNRNIAKKTKADPEDKPREPKGQAPPADPEHEAARKLKLAQMMEDGRVFDKAKARYREIIKKYPDTKAAGEARNRFGKLDQ